MNAFSSFIFAFWEKKISKINVSFSSKMLILEIQTSPGRGGALSPYPAVFILNLDSNRCGSEWIWVLRILILRSSLGLPLYMGKKLPKSTKNCFILLVSLWKQLPIFDCLQYYKAAHFIFACRISVDGNSLNDQVGTVHVSEVLWFDLNGSLYV